jgi:hypothetical protein
LTLIEAIAAARDFQETRRGFLQLKMYADSDATCSEVITDNNPLCTRRKYRWSTSASRGKSPGKPSKFPIFSPITAIRLCNLTQFAWLRTVLSGVAKDY